ncbi:hypothetical protein NECAME_15894 [Necator americanus]|uniref:Uncharacterized protein n=1 Tax=Necator americanus TaxID=51031 RepID=W2SHU0_NECAM|nr:hypothetical protein NECAME_15894 [Necator americanus]ETN68287.1 hypothetical protein NECAME_15894 [Necator americanus]
MKIKCLFALLAMAYGATETASPTEEKANTDDVITNVTKMSRDAPPIVAYNQGSVLPSFPAVSRIRSKVMQNKAENRRAQTNVAVSGMTDDLQELLVSEPTSSRKGAFSRKPTGTGSTYSIYGTRSQFTGEPYLNGYRGIPETQDTSIDMSNYVGALTKPSARKHTFGSYGTADSGRTQAWLSRSIGSGQQQFNTGHSGYGMLELLITAMNYPIKEKNHKKPLSTDFTNSYSNGYGEYNNGGSPSFGTYENPYSAGYQGGNDQDYGITNQQSHAGIDYSGYGSQTANGFSTATPEWSAQGYGPNDQGTGYGSTGGWQSAQNQYSTWQQPLYVTNTANMNGQSTAGGYPTLQVEQMPKNLMGYGSQAQIGGYENGGYGYGTIDGGQTVQQNYGRDGDYSSYSTQMPSYQNMNYGSSPYGNGQQLGYGKSDYYTGDSGTDSFNYQVTSYPSYGSAQGYDNYGSQSQYESTYTQRPTSGYGSSSYYQKGGYSPSATSDFSSYTSDYGTNNGYRSEYGGGSDYQTYVRPQVKYSLNGGYGSQKAASASAKLTNRLILPVEDGYKAKNA